MLLRPWEQEKNILICVLLIVWSTNTMQLHLIDLGLLPTLVYKMSEHLIGITYKGITNKQTFHPDFIETCPWCCFTLCCCFHVSVMEKDLILLSLVFWSSCFAVLSDGAGNDAAEWSPHWGVSEVKNQWATLCNGIGPVGGLHVCSPASHRSP